MKSINEYFYLVAALYSKHKWDEIDKTYRNIERQRSVDSLCGLQGEGDEMENQECDKKWNKRKKKKKKEGDKVKAESALTGQMNVTQPREEGRSCSLSTGLWKANL